MIPLLIVLGVLLLLLLFPFGARVTYSADGFLVHLRLAFFHFRLYPPRREKTPEEKAAAQAKKAEKKAKKEAKAKAKAEKKKKPEQEEEPQKGGALATVRAVLPLIGPALSGLKKRLTIYTLRLQVTWGAKDPADAALGYGRAQAALGVLWPLINDNFKVKDARLGCNVDFGIPSPAVYLRAGLSLNLWKVLTLVLPILVRFLKRRSQLLAKQEDQSKKEGIHHV